MQENFSFFFFLNFEFAIENFFFLLQTSFRTESNNPKNSKGMISKKLSLLDMKYFIKLF